MYHFVLFLKQFFPKRTFFADSLSVEGAFHLQTFPIKGRIIHLLTINGLIWIRLYSYWGKCGWISNFIRVFIYCLVFQFSPNPLRQKSYLIFQEASKKKLNNCNFRKKRTNGKSKMCVLIFWVNAPSLFTAPRPSKHYQVNLFLY